MLINYLKSEYTKNRIYWEQHEQSNYWVCAWYQSDSHKPTHTCYTNSPQAFRWAPQWELSLAHSKTLIWEESRERGVRVMGQVGSPVEEFERKAKEFFWARLVANKYINLWSEIGIYWFKVFFLINLMIHSS